MTPVYRVCLIALYLLGVEATCSAVRSPMTVLGSEVAIPGQISAVQVTLQDNLEHNVTLVFSCPRTSNLEPLAQNTVKMQKHGTLTVTIPNQVSGLCQLEVLLDCPEALLEAQNRSFCLGHVMAPLRVVGSVRDVIIRPTASHFRPGDELLFWVLALDRDLRIASDILANIYVRDPSGIKVKLWEQILITSKGAKQYTLSLSPYARPGLWTLEVIIEGEIFSRVVNVSSEVFPPSRRVAIAQRHFVELRFMNEMKKTYKPGLPFVGMIESVSSEKAIRVRVKVLDDVTSIYSQDIEMLKGEGMFVVPAVISDADHIIIQAELVSVDGKEIDSHYILAKEVIKKWTSNSDCYLLIEGVQHTLEPQQVTEAIVISSCPCSQNLHYMIVTEGHVTSWSKNSREEMSGLTVGQHIFDNATSTSVCKFNFSFTVGSSMSPVSNLVVYYVDENQTVVADLVSFRVNLSNNKISTIFDSEKHYVPGEKIEMQVFAEHDSTVCLVGGKVGDSYFEHRFPYKELELSQAGVSLFDHAHCSTNSSHHPKHRHHHYSVFPDVSMETTWLWRCFNYTKDMSSRKIKISAPRDPGKYYLRSLMLPSGTGESSGLRYSEPALIKVFSPLSVQFHMPEYIRTGEVLQVDVSVENNVNDCVDVSSILTLNGGALFYGTNQAYIGDKLRLGPQGATSIVVKFLSSTPGYNNFTAEVTGFVSDSCLAQKSSQSVNQEVWTEEALGTFVQSSSILVLAEGQIKTRTESAYFCANEQLVTLPATDNHYKWLPAPRNKNGIFISMMSSGDVSIVLNNKGKASPQMYSVTVGPNKAVISWGKHAHGVHLTETSVPNLLSSDAPSIFWITWDSRLLTLGRQWEPHNQTLLQWPMERKFQVNYIGLKAAFGHSARFRVWNHNEESGFSQVLHLDVPRSILPGTERGLLLLAGGLALPSYLPLYYPYPVGSNTLTRAAPAMRALPQALTEYTSLSTLISSFSPALLFDIDPSLNQYKPELLKQVEQNLQRLFQYRLEDYSFGDHYNTSSIMNTISVLELLTDIQSCVSVDPDVYSNVKRAVQNYQTTDGGFSDVDTTAFALSVLIQVGVENDNDSLVISQARQYLESQSLDNTTDSLSLSVITYALVLSKSEKAVSWLAKLRSVSSNEEGDFGWTRGAGRGEWIYEDQMLIPNDNENSRGLLQDYRASLYCLLIHTKLKDLEAAEPVAKYLTYRIHVLDNHSELLYSALKSLALFSSLADDAHRSLTVSLATSNMELTDTLELRTQSTPCPLELPSLPTKVFVYSTGAGCATIQGRVTYSTYNTAPSNAVLEIGGQILREFLPGRPQSAGKYARLLLKTCLRWKGQEPSGVVKLEIFLFSGYSLDSVHHVSPGSDTIYDSRGAQVWFVFPNLKSTCTTCLEYFIQTRFTIEAMRPIFARAYPTTAPYMNVGTFFHSSLDSPLAGGATQDDFESWFGANYTEPQNIFRNECKCHRACHHNNQNHAFIKNATTRIKSMSQGAHKVQEKVNEEITTDNFQNVRGTTSLPAIIVMDDTGKNDSYDSISISISKKRSKGKMNQTTEGQETLENNTKMKITGHEALIINSTAVTHKTVITNLDTIKNKTNLPETTPSHFNVVYFLEKNYIKGVNKTKDLLIKRVEPKKAIDIEEALMRKFSSEFVSSDNNTTLNETKNALLRDEERKSSGSFETAIQTSTNAKKHVMQMKQMVNTDQEILVVNGRQNKEANNADVNISNQGIDRALNKYKNVSTSNKAIRNLQTLLTTVDQKVEKEDESYNSVKSYIEKVAKNHIKSFGGIKNYPKFTNIKNKKTNNRDQTVTPTNFTKENKKSSKNNFTIDFDIQSKIVDIGNFPPTTTVDRTISSEIMSHKNKFLIQESLLVKNGTEGKIQDTTLILNQSPVKRAISKQIVSDTEPTPTLAAIKRSELNQVGTTQHHRAYFHLIQSHEITIAKPNEVETLRDNPSTITISKSPLSNKGLYETSFEMRSTSTSAKPELSATAHVISSFNSKLSPSVQSFQIMRESPGSPTARR